jgi:hypothetical protein
MKDEEGIMNSRVFGIATLAVGICFTALGVVWVTAAPSAHPGPHVLVTNTSSQPVPTTIVGPSPILVEVTNEPATRTPVMKNSGLLIAGPGSTGASFDIAVPEGQRFVVESVGFRASDTGSPKCFLELSGTFNGVGTGQIPIRFDVFIDGSASATTPVLLFFDGGTSVHVSYTKSSVGSLSNAIINISGYLEPMPN